MSDKEVYLLRAAEARADAETATLENVRERCLRAESAWIAMADRVEHAEKLRAARIAEKEAAEAQPIE